MNKSFRYLGSIILLAAIFIFPQCTVTDDSFEIILSNPLDSERVDEPISISRADIESFYGVLPSGKVPLISDESGNPVPSQVDDLNGDGSWDELFFLYSSGAREKSVVTVRFVDYVDFPDFPVRSNIRMAEINDNNYVEVDRARRLSPEEGQAAGVYQMEGPGWENDKVGFRNYLDARNGMDIFGKVVAEMVLDRVGINENYHVMQNWGMDILKVGTSLGSGAIALEIDDVLHRIAPGAESYFERVADGPLRSLFRLHFNNWIVDDESFNIIHEISIHGGAWYYISRVSFPGLSRNVNLIGGITTLDLENKEAVAEHIEEKVAVVMTHGNQAIEGENLGMAIMVPEGKYGGYRHIEEEEGVDITSTFLISMPVADSTPVEFRFYSCWEVSDSAFSDSGYFYDLVREDARRAANPVSIEFN